jgi:hypothetical protein
MGALRQLETHLAEICAQLGVLAFHFLPLCQDARRARALTSQSHQDKSVSVLSLCTSV